ncbi:MAG: threonine synthase [Candidatus Omnitrophica bacterium]|nr:threonine synthase [Candidatus Omnitrophota bacterium]
MSLTRTNAARPGGQGLMERYRRYLPVSKNTPVVSLNEGRTPLIYSEKLSRIAGLSVHLKYEGTNPTGSFKDRGMTVAVSKAKEKGARAVICASTGNTSASAAAYAARAGMSCYVILPEGAVALGKLSQAMMCRAKVIPIRGNFDEALAIVREVSSRTKVALVNSVNPDRIEGQKTGAFEICDAMTCAPDFHLIPVGNAGNITAYWKGYRDYAAAGRIRRLPRMMGFQAKGASPMVSGKIFSKPQTIATAIRIGNPASWLSADLARSESGGLIDAVTDPQILAAYRWLAAEEGVFVEPASAASVAGLFKLVRSGQLKKIAGSALSRKTAVCILTGHGLKDPSTALDCIRTPRPVPARLDAVLKEMHS